MVIRLFLILISMIAYSNVSYAACGANTRTWEADSATTAWNTNNNWNPTNRPNTAAENALIISDWFNPAWPNNNYTLGCLEIQSGTMSATNNRRVTIVGDYFRNLNPGSLILGGANRWEVVMQGTADQTFENVDLIPRLRINNANEVRLTESFEIRNRFLIDAGTGLVIIEKNVELQQTTDFAIPAGTTVTIDTGGSLTLAGNLTISGTLVMEPGSSLILASGRTLNVAATGALDINGVAGNSATIKSASVGVDIAVTINGAIDAQYLTIDGVNTTGFQMFGSITRFDNVSVNNIASGGSGLTIGVAATPVASFDSVGFNGDSGGGPFTNVNASAYAGTAIEFTNWSGLGDTANENDPNGVINWGTESSPVLQVQDISGAGVPPATIAKGSAATEFATFAFSMSGTAATATDVTQVILTMDGTNFNSDINNVQVFNDTNNNCVFDSGTDSLIGTFSPTGVPGKVTVNLSSSEINVIDTTQDCLHVSMATAATATTSNTIGVSIEATDDVTNSQAYALSDINGPPVRPGTATITGSAVRRWNGGFGTNMFTNGNWTPNGVPNNTLDCEIGNGYSIPRMTGAFNCQNTLFQSSGTINWNNTTNNFDIYGALVIENGFTFQNSNNANIQFLNTGDQSVTMGGVTFPGDVTVNSGGIVTFEDSGTISGDLSLTGGSIVIGSSATLQVSGNISVASGTTFDIEPGGQLILGNGSTLTVNSGGVLELVGTAINSSSVRAVNDSSSYTITVNNGATIRAQHYSLRNLGLTGLTVNASATIDGTNNLQNGSFTFPGVNNADLLRIFQEIPGDVLDGMTFESDGSGATGVENIFTSTGATADSLSMTNYSGDLAGEAFDNETNYLVSWDSATNELKISQESTAPASSNQGAVVDMGTFGFEQLNAGTFNDTDLTSIRITLIGTGSSADVDSVTLYYDSACSGSGGTLIGTQAFSGNPARSIFSGISGATVQADAVNPPLRCINVEFNLNALASNSKTVGAQISLGTHVSNSEGYSFNASFAPPINLGTTSIIGTTTQWTGAVSTDWYNAANWTGGVPNANLNCIINDQANDPLINAGTAICKSMDIGNGTLTLSGGSLELYGSLDSTGTINATAPVIMRDNGVTPTSQNIDITSSLQALQFNKTAGGFININSDVDVTNAINISGAQNFIMNITNNNALIANGGLTLTGATIDMDGGSELQIGSGQTLTINGGTFRTSGTNDAYPQTLSTKAQITNTGGSGTWSFSASSGTVDLTGFYIEWLDTNGLNLSGSVNLSNLNGGQLRNLPNSPTMRAIQLTTSGSLPSTASNFGWNWGPSNTPPAEASPYFLAFSGGCGSQTISFDQWFGDFWPFTTATVDDKISETACDIIIDPANSPVALTRLVATAYDGKVVVEWTTGNEWDHRGFNIYRSLNPNDSFVQINNKLIRNDIFSTTIHGTYAFIDEGVNNGQTYYYMLEDLSLMGESTLHGPLEASPDASLGNPPPIQAGTIADNSNQNGGGGSDSSGGDVVEISENVWVLSQTDSYMRIKIVVPALSMAADPLNGSYQKLSINGYSPSTEAGRPELLNKTVMIPVPSNPSSANFTTVSENTSLNAGVAVTPAAEYVPVGGTVIPQWTIDSAFYAISQSMPNNHIELANVVELNGQHFLPLVVHALKYNPVTQDLVKANEIVLDLNLEAQAPWEDIDTTITPWMREGSIKLGFLSEGLYQITYEDLYNAGVVSPLDGEDISQIHLQISSVKMGLEINSADSTFGPGDNIRFYAPQLDSDEDLQTFAVLYADSSEASSILADADASISGEPETTAPGFWTKRIYEENNLAIFNEPFTEETDHFVWSLIYGISGGPRSPLDFDVELPYLSDSGSVTIRATVKSRTANSVNTHHNLEVYINGNESIAAETDFQAQETTSVRFQIPADKFVQGRNRIQLVATGDNLTAGEYDMLYVDKVDVYYYQDWITDSDEALLIDQRQNFRYQVGGFSDSDIEVYDVSHPTEFVKLTNTVIGANADGDYVQYALNGSSSGRRLWVGRPGQFKSINSYKLISGSQWQNTNNQADVVFIGHRDFLQVAKRLGDYRESEGHRVAYVELESLYNEFGNGRHNVSAIRDFVTASRSWALAPKYFILLGDGTYDPKAHQNGALKYRFPVKFIKGSSFDYVSDHWFISDENGIPQEVVGRIPAQSEVQLSQYVEKVLSYERGFTKPSILAPVQMISDKPLYAGEDFETPVEEIQSLNEINSLVNERVHIKRSQMTDPQLKQAIVDSFSSGSMIHYMGHGSENIWADMAVFDNNDAKALNNNNFPIVIAMNCLNAQYADPSLNSFAEELVFNPNGGAIAFWGSTSLTPPSVQKVYQNSFYSNLGQGQFSDLGDLVKTSKIQGGLSSPYEEVLYSWSIIGDPMVSPSLSFSQNVAPDSGEAAPEPSSSSSAGGCSAMASERLPNNQTPWALILAFLLEVAMILGSMRLFRTVANRRK